MSKSLAKNTVLNVIYTVSNLLFTLITSMYVSRILLADGVGQVSYAQNIASYFVTFAALGTPTYGIREIARARADRNETNKVYTELFLINLVSTVLSTVAYLVLIMTLFSSRPDYLLFLCCGLQIAMNVFNINWLYQGHEEYGYITARSIFIKLLSFIAVFVFVKSREDYIIYALINVLAICGNYIFNIVHSRKLVRFTFKNLQFKRHLTPLAILAVTIFLSTVYSKVDVTMLGSMSSDTAVGLYTNAHRIIDIVVTVCVCVSTVFLPRFSHYYKTDHSKFLELIELGIRVLCFFAVPAAVALFLLAPDFIVVLFGSSFALGATTVRIFSALVIIKSFGDLLCYQLVITTGNERKRLPAYFAAAIANIVLNALFIPKFAQNGAAMASVISEFILNLWQLLAVRKIVKFSAPKKAIVQSLVSTAIMAAAIIALNLFVNNLIVRLIASVALGIVVYLVINLVMKNSLLMNFKDKALKRLKKSNEA